MPYNPADMPRSRARPRSKLFLEIGANNPYGQLQVSPSASTDEINDLIDERRSQANRNLKAKTVRSSDDPDERKILQLDEISAMIGDDRRRAQYDARSPQNVLLTVQKSGLERASRRHARSGLVSEWLHDIADDDALLPTPRCLKFWAPSGLDPALRELLDAFSSQPSQDSAPITSVLDMPPADMPSVLDLDNLTGGD